MREDVHAIILSMTRSGQCHAKHAENAVLVYNTCLDKSAAVYKAYLTEPEIETTNK